MPSTSPLIEASTVILRTVTLARALFGFLPIAAPFDLSGAVAPKSAQPRPAAHAGPSAAVETFVVETGEIAGAKFALALPKFWNNRVLLIAHGYRAEDRPLVADLFPEHLAYQTLLTEGWIVAKTSFRRNGIIVADAIADLDALRAHIATKFGPPERVFLEGESMGGLIATLIAERAREDPPLYDGAVAIGAALDIKEGGSNIGVSLQPRIPLLFLSNQSELAGPRAYVEARVPLGSDGVQPILFRVSRDGHVNVNQRERLAALRALGIWLDNGRSSLPRPPPRSAAFDVTVIPAAVPSRVQLHADSRGLDSRVIEVSAVYGNVFLDTQPSDLAAAGIAPGTWFELTAGGQKFRTRYGSDFSSVKRGEWVVFPNADGFLWLSRNFEDAAATASLKLGDTVTLRLFDDTK